ncbi:MAG: hypothetical protein D6781_11845 [Verrucomicrobia bacterium]|nr:MAG: hypothetical protein D6781_11845 [Verrucomicrobiota bacterium]
MPTPKLLTFVRVLIMAALPLCLLQTRAFSQRIPSPVLDDQFDRDLAELSLILDEVRVRKLGSRERVTLSDVKLRLARRNLPPKSSKAERIRLARAWKLIGQIERDIFGDTEQVVESYRLAAALDPDDSEITGELAFRERKLAAVNERLEEAKQLREAKGIRR